jgi:hypothetical protein
VPPHAPSDNGSPNPVGSSGAKSLQVTPSAIPGLISALQSSLDSVGLQIEHAITDLRIRPWAGDPVSGHAANQFNQRSVNGDDDALTALCGYRDQLQLAADSLQRANQQYQLVEEGNIGRLNGG